MTNPSLENAVENTYLYVFYFGHCVPTGSHAWVGNLHDSKYPTQNEAQTQSFTSALYLVGKNLFYDVSHQLY